MPGKPCCAAYGALRAVSDVARTLPSFSKIIALERESFGFGGTGFVYIS